MLGNWVDFLSFCGNYIKKAGISRKILFSEPIKLHF